MSCNCNNIGNKCADNGCSCGIFIDIYEGITLLHTIQADYACDCDGYSFTFNEGSINNVFHEDDRDVTVRYNTRFSRWEMVYYDDNLEGYIPFALYYTKDSSCPDGNNGFTIGSCGWDDNRNVSYVKVNSVVVGVAVWDGTRTNGYKVYRYYPDEYPGTYTDPFKITFDTVTNKWVVNLNGVDIAYQVDPGPAQLNFPNDSFTAIAPFSGTIFLDTHNGVPPTPGNVSPSGTLNFIKIRNIDCGCCDESVLIDLTYNDILYTDVVATVVRDEYGNALGVNGYQYYSFEILLVPYSYTFYLFYDGSAWVMSESVDGEGEILSSLKLNSDCPFGAYTTYRTVTYFSVIGADCFDCCDYYRPGNRNLLKKKKAIFVDEISSIRNKEIFGFKCGTSWDDLFRKHLIFDVLNCLPYGVICDEEEQCLIKNLNENCNC